MYCKLVTKIGLTVWLLIIKQICVCLVYLTTFSPIINVQTMTLKAYLLSGLMTYEQVLGHSFKVLLQHLYKWVIRTRDAEVMPPSYSDVTHASLTSDSLPPSYSQCITTQDSPPTYSEVCHCVILIVINQASHLFSGVWLYNFYKYCGTFM